MYYHLQISFIYKNNKMTEFNAGNLRYVFKPGFYNSDETTEIIENLKNIEFNKDEDSQVLIFGKYRNIPRKQTAFGDDGLSYKFSGNEVKAKQWPDFLNIIKNDMQEYLEQLEILPIGSKNKINYCLINWYRDGDDNIGPHSDDEKDLIDINGETVIISLSFGATRTFRFQL
jgi:DNA oxidative demethylase